MRYITAQLCVVRYALSYMLCVIPYLAGTCKPQRRSYSVRETVAFCDLKTSFSSRSRLKEQNHAGAQCHVVICDLHTVQIHYTKVFPDAEDFLVRVPAEHERIR